MAESVPVRCPVCRREHLYAAPPYPCVCGAPVTPELDRLAKPSPVTHRIWDEEWATVRCRACDHVAQWPHPELGCPCGTTLRIPVVPPARPGTAPEDGTREGAAPRDEIDSGDGKGGRGRGGADTDPARTPDVHAVGGPDADAAKGPDVGATGGQGSGGVEDPDIGAVEGPGSDPAGGPRSGAPGRPGSGGGQGRGRARIAKGAGRRPGNPAGPPRPAFQPVTIRTARDAVTAAALYLRWLGYRDIRRADQRPPSGIGLAARGILAQVDPTVRPASLRDVECLWLTAMTESAGCVYFSLAGYADEARARADSLGVPLFVLDLTGTPQPVNTLADELAVSGA
ncbi:hypothetical protein ABZ446_36450 [Streptomyces sp. NPDC005813]|uniref:hypothetical protein n=1 Tax=Streptomyces sp. NPDC005813 TaxID=3155592 RepID=UPI0033C8A7EF